MLDDKKLSNLVEELSVQLRAAIWDDGEWEAICGTITAAFPGSYCAMLSQSSINEMFSFQKASGLDPHHLRSFVDHYAGINPWQKFWSHAPNGAIIVAERDDPASNYRSTEFYEDWMRRVGDYDAAVGMRLTVDKNELIYLPVHYSPRFSESYDRALEAILRRVQPALQDALELRAKVAALGRRHNAASALIGLEQGPAFTMTEDLRLEEANAFALEEFEACGWLALSNGRVRIKDHREHQQLIAMVAHPKQWGCNPGRSMVCRREKGPVVLTISRLPLIASASPLRTIHQFLVRVRDPHPQPHFPDVSLLREAFALTISEAKFCVAIASGFALARACQNTGISYENGRQKLKAIFAKTGACTQADLRTLLQKF